MKKVVLRQYQGRHHAWVMEAAPTMPEDQWQQYLAWVTAFGAQLGHNRKYPNWSQQVRKRQPRKTVLIRTKLPDPLVQYPEWAEGASKSGAKYFDWLRDVYP